jgi:hypothetical protein
VITGAPYTLTAARGLWEPAHTARSDAADLRAELPLDTNDCLTAARRIYQRHGFTLVAEKPHHSFGVDLVGQDWRLGLGPAPAHRMTRDDAG